jgi:hypothetical protein
MAGDFTHRTRYSIAKGLPMVEPQAGRSVEELAQALYEASDPAGPPWAKRGRVVREPWLQAARERIARSDDRPEPDGEVGSSARARP